MVRTYKRTSSRGTTPPDVIKAAVEAVLTTGRSVRDVADQYSMCHVTLFRYVKKTSQANAEPTGSTADNSDLATLWLHGASSDIQ